MLLGFLGANPGLSGSLAQDLGIGSKILGCSGLREGPPASATPLLLQKVACPAPVCPCLLPRTRCCPPFPFWVGTQRAANSIELADQRQLVKPLFSAARFPINERWGQPTGHGPPPPHTLLTLPHQACYIVEQQSGHLQTLQVVPAERSGFCLVGRGLAGCSPLRQGGPRESKARM